MQQYLEEVQTMIRTYTGAPVPESALEELLGIGTLQVFPKGELIIAAGEESSILYILLQDSSAASKQQRLGWRIIT